MMYGDDDYEEDDDDDLVSHVTDEGIRGNTLIPVHIIGNWGIIIVIIVIFVIIVYHPHNTIITPS